MSWARKKLKVKQPGIDEEEDKLSRHLDTVATSSAQEMRSRHQQLKEGGRDIIQQSRHHHLKRAVATSVKGRDSSSEGKMSRHHLAVATLSALKRRSRQHLAVATSIAKT